MAKQGLKGIRPNKTKLVSHLGGVLGQNVKERKEERKEEEEEEEKKGMYHYGFVWKPCFCMETICVWTYDYKYGFVWIVMDFVWRIVGSIF